MRVRFASILLALAALLSTAACTSQTGFGRARTLPAGELHGNAGLTASLISAQMSPGDPVPLPYLDLQVGAHYGLTDGVEVGGRLWGIGIRGVGTWGVAADTKVSLMRSDEAHTGWNIAVASGLAYHQFVVGGTPSHAVTLTVPLLFGYQVNDDALVFGPRIMGGFWFGQGQGTIEELAYGLSAAYHIGIGDGWELVPEVVLMGAPVSFNGEVEDEDSTGVGFLHLGFGVGKRF